MADLCWGLTIKHKEYIYSVYMSDTSPSQITSPPLPLPAFCQVSPAI